MPETLRIEGQDYEVATEAETLEFANKLRAAGAADPIEALMPSTPYDPNSCLIANALNFSCKVGGSPDPRAADEDWAMIFPENMPEEQAQQIAAAMELPLHVHVDPYAGVSRYIILPVPIGNVALAFDNRVGWPAKYREEWDMGNA